MLVGGSSVMVRGWGGSSVMERGGVYANQLIDQTKQSLFKVPSL